MFSIFFRSGVGLVSREIVEGVGGICNKKLNMVIDFRNTILAILATLH